MQMCTLCETGSCDTNTILAVNLLGLYPLQMCAFQLLIGLTIPRIACNATPIVSHTMYGWATNNTYV